MMKSIKKEVIEEIENIVGKGNIRTDKLENTLYSYDASMSRAMPSGVIHFTDINQISSVVKILYKNEITFSPRAAGTNLSGGTINLKGGFILNLARLDKIHQIDTFNKIAVVEPGVVNLKLQEELAKFGFFYPPDPASQKVSTIGGNIAENAGGPQCLKYGVTSDNLIKIEVVLPDGTEEEFSINDKGFEIMSIFPQSEGTLGIIKKAWLRILPIPKFIKTISANFNSIDEAINCVTEIISYGIIPKSLEAIDRLSIEAAQKDVGLKIPENVQAILIIEIDSEDENDIEKEKNKIIDILKNKAIEIKIAKDEKEKELLWKLRKEAYPALARISPNVLVEDGTVPRPKLPEVVREIKEILSSYKLKAGIVFHAGDGNIHPNIIFDERDLEETKRVRKAGHEILKACINAGGTISGEHGVGVEKRAAMNWLYSNETIELFKKIKNTIDKKNILNPDKKIPISGNQIEKIKRNENIISENAKKIIEEIKLRYNNKEKTAIIGSHSRSMEIPQNCKIIKTDLLNKILDLDEKNFTITVESGIKIKEFKDYLNSKNLDINIPDLNGTIGGMIAVKEFIELRNIITGMDILLSNGNFVRLGGKNMKDVSGYDVIKLMIGSYGTLALILDVTFKINKKVNFKFTKFNNKPQFRAFHKIIKKAFDEENLFNPWLLEPLKENKLETNINYEQI